MSQTVIFSVGIVIFALTIWGAVMAGSVWMGQLADPDDPPSGPNTGVTGRRVDDVDGAPRAASQ
jgi:hypothetical protein